MYEFGAFLRRVFCFTLLLCILITAASALPSVSATSAALYNASTGEFFFEKNSHERRGMASTTKIMTALVALRYGNPDAEVTVSANAIGVEGSSLYLKAGEKMTLRDLLYGLMLQSANDAAEAIAIAIAGSVDNFVALMNAEAASLGLSDTHFTNPHGLADYMHYTTARELAIIAAEAMKEPLFCEICSSQRAAIPNNGDGKRYLVNHNKLLFTYDGAVGVKTGFTKATGRCLVSAAERDGVKLIAVTLCAPDDWRDHTSMLDCGFAEYERVLLANAGDVSCILPLLGGDRSVVTLYNPAAVSVVLKKNHDSIVERIELNRPRFAPVYEQDSLGRVVWMIDSIEIASAPLVADSYVGRAE